MAGTSPRPPSPGIAWHALDTAEALRKLRGRPEGLAPEQVASRQIEFGPNLLPGARTPTLWAIILHQFKSPLIYILLAAAVVALALNETSDAIFIFIVLALNATLGTFQEWRAEQSAASLQTLLDVQARVRRAGQEVRVSARELVPGDIVLLESGERVSADLRLLDANNLTIDESFLTGENIAPRKTGESVGEDLPLGDRTSMAFAGSMVMTGRGLGVVAATGLATQVGQIAASVTRSEGGKPPLLVRMEKFAHQISLFVGGAVVLLALVGLARGLSYAEVFFLAVALAVSAIPEGLPVAMTVALSIGVQRMARRNVIVRKLPAVEGLGSCTCIASDKTGTLTVNQQTARIVSIPGAPPISVTGEGYNGDGALAASPAGLATRLCHAAVLCNEGVLERDGQGWRHSGDAMDVAFLALSYKAGVDPAEVRAGTRILGEIPYESERKFAAAFFRAHGSCHAAMKGAVETTLAHCDRMQTPDGDVALDAPTVEAEALRLAREGYRVLAVAQGTMTPPCEATDTDGWDEASLPPMTLLGLVGFLDPLRPEALASVLKCRDAGIRVVMVTGDHPATAYAIARELGIVQDESEVVSGAQLASLDSSETPEFLDTVAAGRVFARVSPLQKRDIVAGLIRAGHYVAVTGDGVNDAPALKTANIGIAMGSGTEVAKDTAEILVTDDNFASIAAGVEEGRFAFDNIRKVTYLLLSSGLAEVLIFVAALFANLPLPLVAVQLLWLNLVTNGIQDVALAFEAGEPGAMKRPPRRPNEGIFNEQMLKQVGLSGLVMAVVSFGYWTWLVSCAGVPEAQARNLLLMLLVMMQNYHAFNCRSEQESAFRIPLWRNPMLVGGVILAHAIHIGAMYVPGIRDILGIAPIAWKDWGLLLGMASVVLISMEAFKFLRRRGASR